MRQNHLVRLQGVPWVERIKDYIEDHLFSRAFKARVGVPPSRYHAGD